MFLATSLAMLGFWSTGLTAAAPTPASDLGALKAIPANAAAFVAIRGVEGVKDRLFGMLQVALPDYAFLAKTLVDGALSNGLDSRKLDGIAKNGPIFIACQDFKELQNDNPNVVIIVAVTDYAKFLKGILKTEERNAMKKDGKFDVVKIEDHDRTYFIAEKSGYAVMAQNKEIANWVLDAKQSIDGNISPALGSRVVNSDVSVFVNLDQGLKSFADQLKEAESNLSDFLKNAAEALPKDQKAGFEVMQKLIGPGFQSLRDSKAALFSIGFAPEGALVRVEAEARNGTQTAKFLSGIGTAALDSMGNQPSGQMFYSGFVGGDTVQKMTDLFSRGLIGEGKEAEVKKMLAALEALSKAGPGENNSSVDMPLVGLTIQSFKDPKAALDATIKNLDFMAGGSVYGNGAIKDKVKVTSDAVTHDGIKFTKAEFTWDFEKMFNQGNQELPDEIKKQIQNAMKELMGEKMEVYLGVSNGEVLTITAPNWAKGKALYDNYKAGKNKVGSVENFKVVRKAMGDRQSLLFLVDPVRYAGKIIEVFKGAFAGMIPLPPGFPANLDKAKPTYIGSGVSLDQNTMAFELFVSSASVQEIYKSFVKPFLAQ